MRVLFELAHPQVDHRPTHRQHEHCNEPDRQPHPDIRYPADRSTFLKGVQQHACHGTSHEYTTVTMKYNRPAIPIIRNVRSVPEKISSRVLCIHGNRNNAITRQPTPALIKISVLRPRIYAGSHLIV